MQRAIWILVVTVCAGLGVWIASSGRTPAPTAGTGTPEAAASAAPPVAPRPAPPPTTATAKPVAPPAAAVPTDSRDEDPAAEAAAAARFAAIQSDARLLERAKQEELAPAADARWSQAVDEAGFTADDVDPAVRELFSSMRLEPRYVEGGAIDGLVIQEMRDDHPLARAGFQVGDRLSRIQGVPLRDPAELPSLIAHLGPNISFCAERDDGETCQDIVLQ